MPNSIAVLLSGRGTNMQAIHQSCASGKLQGSVTSVISDTPDAAGLTYAEQHQIPTSVVDHRQHHSRADFDRALASVIDQYNPTIIALAGFMRVLSAEFTDHYQGRLINIHPSLLPRHRGLETHQKALASGDRWHGCSVHFVSPKLDGGPLIARSVVPVLSNDTSQTLAQRVLDKEHRLFSAVLSMCLQGDCSQAGDAVFYRGSALRYPLTL